MGLGALGFVVVASLGVQMSALIASTLFERLGPLGVSGLRFAVAAVLVVAIVRPRLRGRGRREWLLIGCFGVSVAAMNLFLYLALGRLPFGVALTLEFLGPFAVAVAGVRRLRSAVFPVLGFVGVVLVVRPSGDLDALGIVFGLVAAGSLAAYTVLAEAASRSGGFDTLALAFVVAAALTSPFAIGALPSVRVTDLGPIALAAVLGIVIAFTADFLALRCTSARTVSVLFSFDPVLAALLGLVVLGETLDAVTWVGIAAVSVAGGVSAALAGRVPAPSSPIVRPSLPAVRRERVGVI